MFFGVCCMYDSKVEDFYQECEGKRMPLGGTLVDLDTVETDCGTKHYVLVVKGSVFDYIRSRMGLKESNTVFRYKGHYLNGIKA